MLETPVRTPAGPHRRPRPDLYTVLLALALVAVVAAIVFLWLELSSYEYKTKGGPMVTMAEVQGAGFIVHKVGDLPVGRIS